MKKRTFPASFDSFDGLKEMIDMESLPNHVPVSPRPAKAGEGEKLSPDEEKSLFLAAVEGTRPLSRNNLPELEAVPLVPRPVVGETEPHSDDSREVVALLHDLVRRGRGFAVDQTPEYMGATAGNVSPDLLGRLHQGDFSIQAHIDLHGYTEAEAAKALDRFLKEALGTRKRGVLIVHGRGLCSPGKPVLKHMVERKLSRGYWKKWVLAYSSARLRDGGAGATCVLLRNTPVKS